MPPPNFFFANVIKKLEMGLLSQIICAGAILRGPDEWKRGAGGPLRKEDVTVDTVVGVMQLLASKKEGGHKPRNTGSF